MLITPLGGFHWMPLTQEPRPRRVWQRGTELQGKRILAYEEGGSNGLTDGLPRSTVALLLTPSQKNECVDAWCIRLNKESTAVNVGSGLVGAALFRVSDSGADGSPFAPLLCTVGIEPRTGPGFKYSVEKDEVEEPLILQVSSLVDASAVAEAEGSSVASAMSVVKGAVLARVSLDDTLNIANTIHGENAYLKKPELALGYLPDVLILCRENFVVVVIRSRGIILAYSYRDGTHTLDDDSLVFYGKKEIGSYVVDGAICSSEAEGEVEMNFLLYDESAENHGGKIIVITLSRESL